MQREPRSYAQCLRKQRARHGVRVSMHFWLRELREALHVAVAHASLEPPLWCLPRRQRRRIGCGLGDLAQAVAIRVVKRLSLAGDDQQRVLRVRPCTIGIDIDLDRITIRAERLSRKGLGRRCGW